MTPKGGAAPDVLYLVKPSEENEELRYSLRSLKNLRHGRVFLAGYRPSWVGESCVHIPNEQEGDKYENTRSNLLSALHDRRLGDEFVLMNDDFFIMKPVAELPTLRRLKDIDHYIRLFSEVDNDSYYVTTMRNTRDLLRQWGVKGEISSYELHAPMLFDKHKLLELLQRLAQAPVRAHIRTMYGNYYGVGGERVKDVKGIRDGQDIDYSGTFLSSIDESFETGELGAFVRGVFPEPSENEIQ